MKEVCAVLLIFSVIVSVRKQNFSMAVEESTINKQNQMKKEQLHRNNSASEPNLTTADRKYPVSGFPPGTTVDELCLYRKKKSKDVSWPSDNLSLSQGSFKQLKSEYKRRFKNFYDFGSCGELQVKREELSPVRATKPEDTLKVEGFIELQPEYAKSFIEYPAEKSIRPRATHSTVEIIDSAKMDVEQIPSNPNENLTEVRSKYIKYVSPERRHLLKRPTNLQLEGEFDSPTSETAEKFIEFLLTHRPELVKKPSTLKLEGDMDTKTEMREKYTALEYQPRPPLCKKLTNLHLEGELNIVTEQQEKFVPFGVQQRPPLVKKNTNLHIEGDMEMLPEYRSEFVEYKSPERPRPMMPVNHLMTSAAAADGLYSPTPPPGPHAADRQIHPVIPFLRGSEGAADDVGLVPSRRGSRRQSVEQVRAGGGREPGGKRAVTVEMGKSINNLRLEDGAIEPKPECGNALIDFHKSGKVTPPKRSRRPRQYHLKNEGKMEISPEYSCSYVNFPRARPIIKKPECGLSAEWEMETAGGEGEPPRRAPEPGLGGSFECQPEYRRAYIDYLIRERVERKPRPLGSLGSPPKRLFGAEAVADMPRPTATDGGKRTLQRQQLANIESAVFGPKLDVPQKGERPPPRGASRSVSPAHPRRPRAAARRPSPAPGGAAGRRFAKSVRVENLACRSVSPKRPPPIAVSARSKWMRDSSDSVNSFMVLDKEINNNSWDFRTKASSAHRIEREGRISPWTNA